ncbi:MAG: DUF554 domain-containing protein [Candidatus Pelethousia sp.]|nr:DUF554 domain-containing protein [Candidatus Pelethousia sp.]
MLGTLVNTGAIILGSLMGLLLKKGIPERMNDAIMKGVALCVLYIGFKGCLEGSNALIAILSMVLGAIVGTLLDLEKRLNNLGAFLESRLQSGDGSLSNGFVTASLLFCVGAMAVVGSLRSGLTGDHTMLYAKSLLDGIASIVFTASLGIGVILSAGAVLIYQGAITVLAQALSPVLSDSVIAEMTCVGSLLIIALSLNMLGITKIKVMNYVPAIFIAIGICYLF